MQVQVVQGDQSGRDPPLATPAADVWALGVIAYEVLCGTGPLLLTPVFPFADRALWRHDAYGNTQLAAGTALPV